MISVGNIVSYHAIRGGPVVKYGCKVEYVGILASGEKVAWITGHRGCVSVDCLSSSAWYCCGEVYGKHKPNCMNYGKEDQ